METKDRVAEMILWYRGSEKANDRMGLERLLFPKRNRLLFSHIPQFPQHAFLFSAYLALFDEFHIIFPPIEQASVFYLLFVGQMMMLQDIFLELFIIDLPLFFSC